MKKIAVFGSGPVGLFLANCLKKLGLSPTIHDLRAGHYVRPGHLTRESIDYAEAGLGCDFWNDSSMKPHIKKSKKYYMTWQLNPV